MTTSFLTFMEEDTTLKQEEKSGHEERFENKQQDIENENHDTCVCRRRLRYVEKNNYDVSKVKRV